MTFPGNSFDRSADYSYSETLHADSAGGAAVDERTLGVDSRGSTAYFDLDYAVSLPAGRGADLWKAEAGFGPGILGALDPAVPYDTTTTALTGDPSMDTTLSVSAGLPIGFKFKPANWLFGFVMGAHPMLGVTDTITTSSGETVTTTTVTRTGTTVDATDIAYVYGTPVTTSRLSYSFSEYHYIGITVPLENGIRMDARLNGNLLDFESFTVQAFIPF